MTEDPERENHTNDSLSISYKWSDCQDCRCEGSGKKRPTRMRMIGHLMVIHLHRLQPSHVYIIYYKYTTPWRHWRCKSCMSSWGRRWSWAHWSNINDNMHTRPNKNVYSPLLTGYMHFRRFQQQCLFAVVTFFISPKDTSYVIINNE